MEYVNHSREKRAEMSALVLRNPDWVRPLLEIGLDPNKSISPRACWVLEFVVKKKLDLIFTDIDLFTSSLHTLRSESSIRPMAKICELLTRQYFASLEHPIHKVLTENHLKQITAACFDWLIGEHKVATKAYSMTSLFLLGKKFDWIHPELKPIIEQHYHQGSAAYKARARHILKALKKDIK